MDDVGWLVGSVQVDDVFTKKTKWKYKSHFMNSVQNGVYLNFALIWK